jgi:hypothetical protein
MSSLTASAVGQKIAAKTLIGDNVEAKTELKVVKINGAGLPAGANQGAAGAAAGELWVDTSAANVIKLGV